MALLHYKAVFLYIITITILETNSELARNSIEESESESWKDLSLRHTLKDSCRKNTTCVSLKHTTCLGTQLPYEQTALDLVPRGMTQDEIKKRLKLMETMRFVPKCWAVVQPLLCSVFMPKCSNNMVDLPSPDTCKKVLGPCKMYLNITIWPEFLRCENTDLFSPQCKNEIRETKFATKGKCLSPLVMSDESFDGIDGCGVPCNDPMYTPDELMQIHSFIAWAAGICLVFNVFTFATFVIDWKPSSKYPAVIIFYINCCFMIACIGWLMQFATGSSRDSIVCRKDGTPRINEPSGENIYCAMVFIMVYSSTIAAIVWFVILTYAFHTSFEAYGKIHDKSDKKNSYFHLLAWSIPFVLTVVTFTSTKIEGSSVTGICYVTRTDPIARGLLVVFPILLGAILGGYYLARGLFTLIRLKISSQEIIPRASSSKIRQTILRMAIFAVFIFVAVVVTIFSHIREYINAEKWHKSFRDYMWCSILNEYEDTNECKMEVRPSVAELQIHLLAFFVTGITMASWVWTSSTVDIWRRFLRRTFNSKVEEPVRLKKHKVIAQAFAKRKTFNKKGRLSISLHPHEDPVGMNFELNSAASQDVSSAFAKALPIFVTRRGALVGYNTGSTSSNRRNSVDSEISYSIRSVRVESRRNSLDSQVSEILHLQEVKATRKVKTSSGHRSKKGKRKRDFNRLRSTKSGTMFRRGSTTSQESHLETQKLTIVGAHVPNMKRRSATAGLNGDANQIGMLFPEMEKMLGRYSDSDENSSSEEKAINDKDIEAGNQDKDDSDSEESQADVETKMIEPPHTDKSNNKYLHKNERLRPSNYMVEDETVLRQYIQESEIIRKDYNDKEDFVDSQEGNKLMISENKAREMATQTSLPVYDEEMEELKQSIGEILSNRNCSSKGTQISPQLNHDNRKTDSRPSTTSPVPAPRPSKEGKRRNSNKNV